MSKKHKQSLGNDFYVVHDNDWYYHDFETKKNLKGKCRNNRETFLDPKTSKEGKLKVCSLALHPEFSYPLIDVGELSILKGYKPLNFLDKDTPTTYMTFLSAAQRHLDAAKMGFDLNTEETMIDGTPCTITPFHLAQVAYNCLILLLQDKYDVLQDDRLFKNGIRVK